jgi:hypothetical protein
MAPMSQPATDNEDDYYILCPTRPTEEPTLISHLISRDICEQRQAANFHKCPNCVRSRLWKAAHPLGLEGPAPAPAAAGGSPAAG